jgi:hypothetical protein
MYNKTGITKVTGAAPTQILFNVQHQMSVGIKLAKGFAGAVVENGRKIVKAGTPLSGDLTNRSAAFTAAGATATGILLHDVDITDSDANATLLIWGFVNVNRIDATTKAKLTSAIKTSLAGKVTFLSDN